MRKITRRVTDTSTWAASSDLTAINLPRDGLITEIGIRAAITMNTGTMATNQPDALRRVIQNLRIEGDGGRSYLGLSGEQFGRLLGWWNAMEFGGSAFVPLLDAITESYSWVFHPGSNPRDPFDITAVIPARALSTLQSKLTTTANTVVDDSQTISSGTYYYWVNEVLDVKVSHGVMTPLGSSLSYAHTANYSDFSYDIDIPAGAFLRRIIMLVQDETATRAVRKDDEVAGVKIKMPKSGEYIMEARWDELKVETAKQNHYAGGQFQLADAATGALSMPDGFVIIDLRKYANPLYGLDLTNYQTGDFKLGLTIENYTSGDDTLIYWDQLIPVESQYVGK